MAIQFLNKKNIFNKIYNTIWIIIQIIQRSFNSSYIFYRYRTTNVHPAFNQPYLFPPVKGYANIWNAKLFHWVNSPMFIDDRPFIIEINDHPFSIAENIKNIDRNHLIDFQYLIGKIYADPNCKKILFPCDKFKDLFQFYFSELKLDDKFTIVPSLGLTNSITYENNTDKLKFLCIASDFFTKGVDLIIKAWLIVNSELNDASLTIVCHNIPQDYINIIKDSPNITIINKAPLDKETKLKLYKSHNISIAPMHIHGGAVIIEAVEYSHAIIYFETHTSAFFDCGYEIKVPYYFYSVDNYGINWNTIDEFLLKLENDKKNGLFDNVIFELSNVITSLIKNQILFLEYKKKSTIWANNYNLFENRNKKLSTIYNQVLNVI